MDNLEPRAPELLAEHVLGDQSRAREEIRPASKQDVELYIRTYNTMLRSSGEVKIKALEQAHLGAAPSLHVDARAPQPDMDAFMYSVNRLPSSIGRVRRVLLGQSAAVFHRHRVPVERWERVSAPGRRRLWYYDGDNRLAVYVNSSSDVDDLIPTLTGYQIEWNKLHALLNAEPETVALIEAGRTAVPPLYTEMVKTVRSRLLLSREDWARLEAAWGETRLWDNLLEIAHHEKSFTVQMLGGSYVGYAKATRRWWSPISIRLRELGLHDRPVYFVSSNTHALVNLLSGSVSAIQPEIERFLERTNDPTLLPELHRLQSGESKANWHNFLYYAARKFYSDVPTGREVAAQRRQEEAEHGIHHVGAHEGLPVDTQIVELARLVPTDLDPRLEQPGLERLRDSRAIMLNIDYPLGLAAYYIFVQIAESLEDFRGIYITGKAATLNGRIGDVLIADSVYEEHTQNTYWLNNVFDAHAVSPYLVFGSVLDNQKAVTVKGTYLQNRQYLDLYYRENYTVVEMEAGPYLNALYETTYPTRHPVGEHINFTNLPFDLGILHYASDTPYSKGANLGRGSLDYQGLDSTYATCVAIARRIMELELAEEARGRQGPAAGLPVPPPGAHPDSLPGADSDSTLAAPVGSG
jgi:hypothetical protein